MKEGNIIEFPAPSKSRKEKADEDRTAISEELEKAIKHLIQRLRKLGPIAQER